MEETIRITLEAISKASKDFSAALSQIKRLNESSKQSEGIFARVNRVYKENTKLIRDLKIAAAAAAGALILIGKHALKNADEMGKQAKQLGILVGEYSKLRFAAELNEVSQQELFRGLAHFSRALSEAKDPASKMAKALEGVGFSAENVAAGLRKGGLQAAFLKLTQGFHETEGEAQKTALAMEFLSRGGKEFVNFLNLGPAAIKALGEEAKALGAIMTEDLAQGSDQVNDNLTKLNFAAQGVRNEVLTALLPGLISLTNHLVAVAKDGTTLKTIAITITAVLKTLAQVAIVLVGAFKTLGLIIGTGLAAAFSAIEIRITGAIDLFDHLFFNLSKVFRSAVALAEAFGELGDVFTKFAQRDFSGAAEAGAKAFGHIKEAAAKLAFDAGNTFKGIARDVAITSSQAEQTFVDTMGQIVPKTAAIVDETKALLATLNSDTIPTPGAEPAGPKRDISDLEAIKRAKTTSAELAKVEADRTALELEEAEFNAKAKANIFRDADSQLQSTRMLALLNLKAQETAALAALDAEEATNAQATEQKKLNIVKEFSNKEVALKKSFEKAKLGLNEETFSALGTLFSDSAKLAESFGKKGFIAQKAFAIAAATVNTLLAVTSMLATGGPPPLNFILAGVVAALGAVQIAQIAGVGFAEGGLVPGAPSSKDNRLAAVATGEYIFDSGTVAKAGPAFFARLHASIRDGSFVSGFARGGIVPRPSVSAGFAEGGLVGAAQSGNAPTETNVKFGFVDTRNQEREFMRKEGVGFLIDMMQRRGNKVFA